MAGLKAAAVRRTGPFAIPLNYPRFTIDIQ